MLLVPVCVMSLCILGPWWAGRHGAAVCPVSRDSQEPLGCGTAQHRGTASTLREGVICLLSASRYCIWFWAPQWEKTPMNCSEFTCEMMGDLGKDVQPGKKITSRGFRRSPPTSHLGGCQLETGISQWCMVGGKGKLQHEVFRLDLRKSCCCENNRAVKQVAWTACVVSILLCSKQSH